MGTGVTLLRHLEHDSSERKRSGPLGTTAARCMRLLSGDDADAVRGAGAKGGQRCDHWGPHPRFPCDRLRREKIGQH